MIIARRHSTVLPGFGLSMGVTLGWVGFLVLFPIFIMTFRSVGMPFERVVALISRPAALHAFGITIGYAAITACANCFIGSVVAWTLTRYRFWGRRVFDALVDLPFALPGAVGGIALATVFGKNGIVGSFVDGIFPDKEIKLVYNQVGILIGLIFVTLPFAVRSVQPLIKQLDSNEEQAAFLMGARPRHVFWKIQFPAIFPGIASAFILSFARSIGEYGTVIFVAGNIPLQSEVVSKYIYNKIDQYDLEGAMVTASVLMAISFLMLVAINIVQAHIWKRKNTT